MYCFLIASLPELQLDAPPPMSVEAFLEICKTELSEEKFAELTSFDGSVTPDFKCCDTFPAIYNAYGKFELYQKMVGEGFELRRGTWTLNEDILSGIYNDGETWAAEYQISINNGELTMISKAEGNETNVYTQCAIPQEVKRNCTVVVKSR